MDTIKHESGQEGKLCREINLTFLQKYLAIRNIWKKAYEQWVKKQNFFH